MIICFAPCEFNFPLRVCKLNCQFLEVGIMNESPQTKTESVKLRISYIGTAMLLTISFTFCLNLFTIFWRIKQIYLFYNKLLRISCSIWGDTFWQPVVDII